MRTAHIKNSQSLITYAKENSTWQASTIYHVITTLGCRSNGGLKSLSSTLEDCAKYEADDSFPGFTYYSDTPSFFRRNRQDIVKNLELMAEELGEDSISMVQHFGVFRYGTPPTPANVGRALWGADQLNDDLTSLYNVFGWFCLEEISHIWYRYLEDNPGCYAELSA
jgi:hypothetical protein